MQKQILNPHLFFIIKSGKIICWDYQKHQQYEIDKDHFYRLVAISKNTKLFRSEIDELLKEADLIVDTLSEKEWGWDYLSKIFHFGTQISNELSDCVSSEEFSINYLEDSEKTLANSPSLYLERKGEKIVLPSPNFLTLENCSLLSTLKNRKTCRAFNGEEISIEILSTLLGSVFGKIRSDEQDYKEFGYEQIGLRKSSPSAGGLHSTEAYLFAQKIRGLPRGVYHYQAHNHVLTLIQKNDELFTSHLFCGQHFATDLSLGIFMTSRFDKLWHKYPHSRAYRIALLDVGHLSQTFQLVATALNLNPWLTGAFIDEKVIELLQLDESCEQPLFFVGAGLGPKSVLDNITKSLVNEG